MRPNILRVPLSVVPFGLTILCGACTLPSMRGHDWVAVGQHVMVASDSYHASQAGLEILRSGGNAFDAAAAVSFALAVTRPEGTGLGGGGFMIGRLAEGGEVVVLDFREIAPLAADSEMFVRAAEVDPHGPSPSAFGYLAAATPGLLAGRMEMLERYGTRTLSDVLQPAIRLARNGFPVDANYVKSCRTVLDIYERHPRLKESCGYVYGTHLRNGNLRQSGDILHQPELARLLEALAREGPDFFYDGPVAEALETAMKERGGIMTRRDLAGYRVKARRPLRSTYRGYELITMPPPSSGGICLAEALNILEHFDLPSLWKSDRDLAWHYIVEAQKHAFADRARWQGDGDFVKVPVDLFTSKQYAGVLAGAIEPDRTHEPDTYGTVQIPDDAGTSHFCIVDRWGNCVVSTETINTEFGSLAAVDEWGVILNNEMDDFTARPNVPNEFDLIQSQRNAVAPGKRPLSSMSPTMALKDGKPVLLLGASGGPRIISSVLNVLIGVVDFGLPLDEAMQARRLHHQWQPDEVFLDAPCDPAIVEALTRRGHRVACEHRAGNVQAVWLNRGQLIGASDPRKGGRPAGR